MRLTSSRVSLWTSFVLGIATACSGSSEDTSAKYDCHFSADSCSCTVYRSGAAPATPPRECSASALAGTVCCADKGWPGTGMPSMACSCSTYSSASGCKTSEVRVDDCTYSPSTSTTPSPTGGTCTDDTPGMTMSPCKKDSDCYSGYCDASGKPGPYCYPPNQNALDSGRGYSCRTNADCAAVLPSDLAPHVDATCQIGTSINGSGTPSCSFYCKQ